MESFGATLPRAFYLQETVTVAQALLNCILVRKEGDGLLAGRITETEAYLWDDPASHSYRGQKVRNATMFGSPGHAYIYFTYGMHYCFNAVTAPEGIGEAVLIRALEPLTGLEQMAARRSLTSQAAVWQEAVERTSDDKARIKLGRALCGGPGKLCQALGLDRALNGSDLTEPRLLWIAPPTTQTFLDIIATPRIGISQGVDFLWRFTLRGDPYTSRGYTRTQDSS